MAAGEHHHPTRHDLAKPWWETSDLDPPVRPLRRTMRLRRRRRAPISSRLLSTVVEHPLFDLVSDDGHPAVSLLVGCPAIDEVTICPIDQGQGQGDLVEDGDQQLVGTGVRCWSATATARPESDHEDWLVTTSGHV